MIQQFEKASPYFFSYKLMLPVFVFNCFIVWKALDVIQDEVLRPYFFLTIALSVFAWSDLFILSIHYRKWKKNREWEALTPEQQAEIERKREDEEHLRNVRKRAKEIGRQIPLHLAVQNKMEHSLRRDGKTRYRPKVVKIRFKGIVYTRTEVWYHIDGKRLPHGTSFHDIANPANNVEYNLARGIRHPVRLFEDKEWRVWIRVGLASGVMGIQKFVKYEAIEKKIEPKPYTVPIGVDIDNELHTIDLTSWPHGIVTGSTGNGKTKTLLMWIGHMIQRHSPADLGLVLIDLKRNAFRRVKTIPHVFSYADTVDDAIDTLHEIEAEMHRRYDTFSAHQSTTESLIEWNKEHPDKHYPALFCFIDELSLLTQGGDKAVEKETLRIIMNIVQLGRQAGVHVIIGTQTVNQGVLPMPILANIEGRVCFGLNSGSASTLVVGNYDAVGLYPEGRAVYPLKSEHIFLQVPYMDGHELEKIVKEVKRAGGNQAIKPVKFDLEIAQNLIRLMLLENTTKRDDVRDLAKEHGISTKKDADKTMSAMTYNYKTQSPVINIDSKTKVIFAGTTNTKDGKLIVSVNGHLPATHTEINGWGENRASVVLDGAASLEEFTGDTDTREE